jgi:hypothetical protein
MSSRKQIIDATAKAQGIADPAVERHKDALFGTPTAKDPTPPDQRNPGPGRVLVEWIGEEGPYAEAKLAAAVDLGLIPASIVSAWTQLHGRITTRIPGIASHSMTRERDGMSETIVWGPYEYVQAVTVKDADTLLSSSFGHQFRILNYAGQQPANVHPIDRYLTPYTDSETVDKVRHIVIEENVPEALRGLEVISDGRGGIVKTGRGAWTPKR